MSDDNYFDSEKWFHESVNKAAEPKRPVEPKPVRLPDPPIRVAGKVDGQVVYTSCSPAPVVLTCESSVVSSGWGYMKPGQVAENDGPDDSWLLAAAAALGSSDGGGGGFHGGGGESGGAGASGKW